MEALLAEFQIPDLLHGELLEYTPAEFGLIALDLPSLDAFIGNLVLPASPPEPLIVARLRLLWKHCHALSESGAVVQATAPAAVEEQGWHETFPKRISVEDTKSLVTKFLASYPGELLPAELMPSPRFGFFEWLLAVRR